MNLNVLKNPIFAIAISVITTLVVALAAAAGFGAFGSPKEAESTELVVPLPANAQKATSVQVEEILRGQWQTASQPMGDTIAFSRSDEASHQDTYLVQGGACNGFGVALVVDKQRATYTFEDRPVTMKGCPIELELYDSAVRGALVRGNTFYVDGTHAYLGKAGKGLKLRPAH